MSKPSIPQGTRDFNATVVRKRNHIFQTIQSVFELYGFEPLETPAMENLETLMGKYGEEGDKLIFKILNNGLGDPKNIDKARKAFERVLEGKNDRDLTERALRYDLTIPFARYVAMNHHQLHFPFKRYQVQPVWRADRPQKGRYREFYQCDADVVGSTSLRNEAELAEIYATVFRRLHLPVIIKVNHRKIFTALAEACGAPGKMMDITVAIDKLDKIGAVKVLEELRQKGLDEQQLSVIESYLAIKGSNTEQLATLRALLADNPNAGAGIADLETLLAHYDSKGDELSVDFTLARGLNYYTGTIFEVAAKEVAMGSIGGGGRYDDLTGLFGVPGIPGVGISFGVDRIYDVMEESDLFPEDIHTGTRVLLFHLGAAESEAAAGLLRQLRDSGVPAELFHENVKLDKQFKYAEKKHIPWVVIIGSRELAAQTATVKNQLSGEQQNMPMTAVVDFLCQVLIPGS